MIMSVKDIVSALAKSRFGPLLSFILLANVFLILGAALNQVFSDPEELASTTDCAAVVQDLAQVPQDSQVPGSVPGSADSTPAC